MGNGSSRLVAFDVDGTLIGNPSQHVVWQIFNEHFVGTRPEEAVRYDAFMERHITYAEWVELDVRDWILAGVTKGAMTRVVREQLHLIPGARQTIVGLRQRGFRVVVISGTLDITLEVLFPEMPFDEVHTNRLLFDGAGLIWDWVATPYDNEGKAHALDEICSRLAVPLSHTVFVGDNINDLHVMKKAGLAIAYEPKAESVRQVADAAVYDDLSGVLTILDQMGG